MRNSLNLWMVRTRYRYAYFWRGPLYAVRYRGFISPPEWTFPEAMKMSRAIPPKQSFEILLPGGAVHFTVPPRPMQKLDEAPQP